MSLISSPIELDNNGVRMKKHMFDGRRITTISFDADETLWDFRRTMRQGLQLALEALQTNLPSLSANELTVEQLIEIRDEVAAEMATKRLSHENDVVCPQQAGIQAIWLNRTGVTPVSPIQPECEIHTLNELSNILFA